MEKIKRSDKVANEEVYEPVGEKRIFLNNILRRKANWIGHIPRRDFFNDAMEGKMTEINGVGSRRTTH